jgi:hypothetical protein
MEYGRNRRESVVNVYLYVEGGGTPDLDRLCRRGFSKFLEAAGIQGNKPRIVASGSRQRAFDNFVQALKDGNVLPLLLVDSEAPVSKGASAWQHLKTSDDFDRPPGAGDDQAFLMVQCMENWFLADRESLKNFFGREFDERKLPTETDLENVGTEKALDALKKATALCNRKRYEKGKISFELLGEIDPVKVSAASKHASKLIERLRAMPKRTRAEY